jgi:hypothetical protein
LFLLPLPTLFDISFGLFVVVSLFVCYVVVAVSTFVTVRSLDVCLFVRFDSFALRYVYALTFVTSVVTVGVIVVVCLFVCSLRLLRSLRCYVAFGLRLRCSCFALLLLLVHFLRCCWIDFPTVFTFTLLRCVVTLLVLLYYLCYYSIYYS